MGPVKGHGPRPIGQAGAIDLKVFIGLLYDVAESETGRGEVNVASVDADIEEPELKEFRDGVVRFGVTSGPGCFFHDIGQLVAEQFNL